MSVVTDDLRSASGPARLGVVVAGFAEKLRGSYWARNLKWEDLQSMMEHLPPPVRNQPRVVELAKMISAARGLDKRVDRFATQSPVNAMDFDQLPKMP